jgi:hypothetical protein
LILVLLRVLKTNTEINEGEGGWVGIKRGTHPHPQIVKYCVILPSGLTFFIYAYFWAKTFFVGLFFLEVYKTLRTAILENGWSHMHVSARTVRFWKIIFSPMPAWFPSPSVEHDWCSFVSEIYCTFLQTTKRETHKFIGKLKSFGMIMIWFCLMYRTKYREYIQC